MKQRPRIPASPRILVVELWQIGDVILSTPFLAALRYCFPDSTITFLGKPHAETLLRASGLADDVIIAELPWTRTERKYHPADYDWGVLRNLLRRLRARRFDVAFDARMDIRSNIFVSLVGAKRRFGFRYGGADWLLTDAVPIDPTANHKTGDWASLLKAAGCQPMGDPRCILTTTEEERAAARAVLSNHFGVDARPIALHPGGSHAGKRWPLDHFDALARELLGAATRSSPSSSPMYSGKSWTESPGCSGSP